MEDKKSGWPVNSCQKWWRLFSEVESCKGSPQKKPEQSCPQLDCNSSYFSLLSLKSCSVIHQVSSWLKVDGIPWSFTTCVLLPPILHGTPLWEPRPIKPFLRSCRLAAASICRYLWIMVTSCEPYSTFLTVELIWSLYVHGIGLLLPFWAGCLKNLLNNHVKWPAIIIMGQDEFH